MGAAFSGFKREGEYVPPGARPRFDDLPESCLSVILGYLDPPEICRMARVSRAFRDASSVDFVWDSKLPSNYKYLVREVLGEDPENICNKEIYERLCRRPNRFDGGTKEVLVDKIGRSMSLQISSKVLKIAGINDRRYWNHIKTDESRFDTVAYLQQIWWVEVAGEAEFHFLPGHYTLFFRLRLGKPSRGLFGQKIFDLGQVHGWDIKPAQFQISTSDGQRSSSECCLYDPGYWVHYHAGDFHVDNSGTPLKINFSMVQIDCTHTKGGLCVDSVLICPRGVSPETVEASVGR
ncbi:hypothetical protein MLD38_008972 [Melastoma candidum]|uniref:Uncharacterized protein n=1 Tax=Melastoma candidum TaxID=119954 RepID=A0ACB9RW87_9MYRT|nr:hypothetical protein MLD38_008972 [Melastoma candidum]